MTATKDGLAKFNVNPTGSGVVGFSNFAETWNGRMAMIGFAAGMANEVLTGKGILAQVGITGAGGLLVGLFLTGFTIATMVGYYAIKIVKLQEETTPQESAI